MKLKIKKERKMSLNSRVISLIVSMFFCLNTAFSAVTKTNDGYINDLNCWQDFDGFIIHFDQYFLPPNVADKITRKGKYIVPKSHPHYREMVSLLTTAGISNLEIALWINNDTHLQGMAVIEDVVVRAKK